MNNEAHVNRTRYYITIMDEPLKLIVASGNHNALAVFTYFCSKPPNWKCRRSDVLKRFPKISKQAYADAIKVLVRVGVARRVPTRVNGKMTGSILEFANDFLEVIDVANARSKSAENARSPSGQFDGRSGIPTVRENGHIGNTEFTDDGGFPREKGRHCPPSQLYNAKTENTEAQDPINMTHEQQSLFGYLWERFPVKTKKQEAKNAFAYIDPDADQVRHWCTALEMQSKSRSKSISKGEYCSMVITPAAWMRSRRWEDDVSEWGENQETDYHELYCQGRLS